MERFLKIIEAISENSRVEVLRIAASNGRLEVVRYLLENKLISTEDIEGFCKRIKKSTYFCCGFSKPLFI